MRIALLISYHCRCDRGCRSGNKHGGGCRSGVVVVPAIVEAVVVRRHNLCSLQGSVLLMVMLTERPSVMF